MTLPKLKLFLYTLMGLTVVVFSCLYLLPSTRLMLPADSLCPANPESKNYTNAANTVPLSLLHSNMTRVLRYGHLPLDEKDNQSWSIFKNDSQEYPCSQYKTRFGVNMPRVWLASFPRSGNTWTRYLLEAASGIFTGSIYHDKELYHAGYLGERENLQRRRTLVQKTHLHSVHLTKEDGLHTRFTMGATLIPTVLLLRNPANWQPSTVMRTTLTAVLLLLLLLLGLARGHPGSHQCALSDKCPGSARGTGPGRCMDKIHSVPCDGPNEYILGFLCGGCDCCITCEADSVCEAEGGMCFPALSGCPVNYEPARGQGVCIDANCVCCTPETV